LLLLKNLLVSREPLYGIGEWAARHVPELLGLGPAQLPSLNDDRIGRCLDRLFDADIPTLALAVVVHAVREFAVDLDELHNHATDDRSHRATWDLLCKLTGRRDFLYVADCKLATAENMAYIHRHGGRFLSVLPRTRGEDAAFRAEILADRVQWRVIHDKYDDE